MYWALCTAHHVCRQVRGASTSLLTFPGPWRSLGAGRLTKRAPHRALDPPWPHEPTQPALHESIFARRIYFICVCVVWCGVEGVRGCNQCLSGCGSWPFSCFPHLCLFHWSASLVSKFTRPDHQVLLPGSYQNPPSLIGVLFSCPYNLMSCSLLLTHPCSIFPDLSFYSCCSGSTSHGSIAYICLNIHAWFTWVKHL